MVPVVQITRAARQTQIPQLLLSTCFSTFIVLHLAFSISFWLDFERPNMERSRRSASLARSCLFFEEESIKYHIFECFEYHRRKKCPLYRTWRRRWSGTSPASFISTEENFSAADSSISVGFWNNIKLLYVLEKPILIQTHNALTNI